MWVRRLGHEDVWWGRRAWKDGAVASSVSVSCVLDSQPHLSVPVSLTVYLPFPCGQQAVRPSQPSPPGYQGTGGAGSALRPLGQGPGAGRNGSRGASTVRQLWSGESQGEPVTELRDGSVGGRDGGDRHVAVGKRTMQWREMCPWWQRWGCEHPTWDWRKGDM